MPIYTRLSMNAELNLFQSLIQPLEATSACTVGIVLHFPVIPIYALGYAIYHEPIIKLLC